MKNKKTISIGIRCFNEEKNVPNIYKELLKVTNKNNNYNYQFVFTDNGSTDNTRNEIKKLAKKDKSVVGIFLSRNFGPESSGQAILDRAKGNAVIMIAGDLQEPPELILKFIKRWEEGYNIVAGIYTKTEDNLLMKFARKNFYRIFKIFTGIDIPIGDSGFGLIDRKALDALNSLPEKYRFYRGLRAWVGFKTAYVKYERLKRKRGKSSYNVFDYVKHAERSFFGFSYIPLDIIIYFGFFLVLLSFIFIIFYLILAVFFGNPIKGSITILVSIVFFGGIQLMAVSVIGKYIQVIVEETKSRPLYIVDETINE